MRRSQPLFSRCPYRRLPVSPVPGKATETPVDCVAHAVACSGKPYESSRKLNLAGWCLRTSLTCSLSTIATTLKQSSGPLRTAGMWDFGECLMLNISESPSSVVEYSWSQVIDACPPFELLADAAPVDAVPPASQSQRWPRPADAWAANTLLADRAPSQIAMGCTTLVAHANGWDQMAERRRASEVDGFCPGSSLLWRS